MTRKELNEYVGNLAQVGGTRHYKLTDGWGKELQCIDVNTGSGLEYTIIPDRGMDISFASFKGSNLVYLTPNGETHPSYYEPKNIGWLHTFTGGLLTTCGLTWLGAPVIDEGEELGLHGRYSTIPAKQVADLSEWVGDQYWIKLRGIVEEATIFGNKLCLEREIVSIQGQNSLKITDKITNFGFKPSPFTILYHMNLGFPLLSEHAVLRIESLETIAKNPAAVKGINKFTQITKPQQDFSEEVYCHILKSDKEGFSEVSIKNNQSGIQLNIKYRNKELPYLVQWKMLGQGDYVLGLEPSNVPLKNRKELKDENILPILLPGESITTCLEVIIS